MCGAIPIDFATTWAQVNSSESLTMKPAPTTVPVLSQTRASTGSSSGATLFMVVPLDLLNAASVRYMFALRRPSEAVAQTSAWSWG